MIYLYLYLIFAVLVSILYTSLYHVYKMPVKVKKASRGEKIRVYGSLILTEFIIAPYGAYEIIKEWKQGGFKK